MVATRARWRVDSKSSESKRVLEPEEEVDGAGEMGKMGEEERRTEDATSTDGKSSTGSPQSVSMRMFKFRVEVHDQGPGCE